MNVMANNDQEKQIAQRPKPWKDTVFNYEFRLG